MDLEFCLFCIPCVILPTACVILSLSFLIKQVRGWTLLPSQLLQFKHDLSTFLNNVHLSN